MIAEELPMEAMERGSVWCRDCPRETADQSDRSSFKGRCCRSWERMLPLTGFVASGVGSMESAHGMVSKSKINDRLSTASRVLSGDPPNGRQRRHAMVRARANIKARTQREEKPKVAVWKMESLIATRVANLERLWKRFVRDEKNEGRRKKRESRMGGQR